MKLVCTSDLHGDLPDPTTMPPGDVLVLAGDLLPDDFKPKFASTVGGTRVERQGWWFQHVFIPWLSDVKHIIPENPAGEWGRRYGKVVFTGGNHDWFLQAMLKAGIDKLLPKNCFYLNESSVEIDGKLFWGAGWNMTRGWAFALTEEEFAEKLQYAPNKIDVAVVHGPPAGLVAPNGAKVAGHHCSTTLSDWVWKRTDIKTFICGHIHESYGNYTLNRTSVYVVSRKDRNYADVNPFVEITIG